MPNTWCFIPSERPEGRDSTFSVGYPDQPAAQEVLLIIHSKPLLPCGLNLGGWWPRAFLVPDAVTSLKGRQGQLIRWVTSEATCATQGG